MAHLLDDLLEASRVTQNKIELRKTVLDLRSVVRETVEAVRTQLDTRGVQLTTTIADEPLHVNGDAARLQQIHANLFGNAAKYTPRGGHAHLEVTRDGDDALIRVRDDGVGIPPEMLEAVFDLFVQSNLTLDRSAGGLGVGLTLVQSLVNLHGGSVTAKSDGQGKGSEFCVRLPLTREQPSAERPSAQSPRVRVPDGAKVVVVEDNADSREMLCEALQQAGFHCKTAGNGLEAMALIDEVRPDIAILDVGLPGMDGFEIARRVRAHADVKDTFLIALTGYGQAQDRVLSREAGFDEHLVKPVRAEHLLRLISDVRATDAARPSHTRTTPQHGAAPVEAPKGNGGAA